MKGMYNLGDVNDVNVRYPQLKRNDEIHKIHDDDCNDCDVIQEIHDRDRDVDCDGHDDKSCTSGDKNGVNNTEGDNDNDRNDDGDDDDGDCVGKSDKGNDESSDKDSDEFSDEGNCDDDTDDNNDDTTSAKPIFVSVKFDFSSFFLIRGSLFS